jgi:hypothetical protein
MSLCVYGTKRARRRQHTARVSILIPQQCRRHPTIVLTVTYHFTIIPDVAGDGNVHQHEWVSPDQTVGFEFLFVNDVIHGRRGRVYDIGAAHDVP